MYVAEVEEGLYALHGFQKKTRKTARSDIDIAKTRYRVLVAERKASK